MKRKVEMTLTPESSSIAAIGYDSKECRLFVRFKAESLYCYAEVGITTFNNFLGAPSKGTFLANAIKMQLCRHVTCRAIGVSRLRQPRRQRYKILRTSMMASNFFLGTVERQLIYELLT